MSESKNNPANAKIPDNFRPLNSAVLRLSVPEKDGFHRHWFRGTPERLARAQQAGYRFVDPDDVDGFIANMDIAGDTEKGGSTDLGSRISVVGGESFGDGQAGRMYLMECPNEYYEFSKKALAERNEGVASALRAGLVGGAGPGETQSDMNHRYRKGTVPDLFNPNKRRP